MCTYLTLKQSNQLVLQLQLLEQSQRESTRDEMITTLREVCALVSSSLPLIDRRMDDNTMLADGAVEIEQPYKLHRL